MIMTCLAPWLQLGGLVAAFVGSLFLAFGQGRMPGDDTEMEQEDSRGQTHSVAFVFLRHPRLWRRGLGLLAFGFALQLLGLIPTFTGATR